MRLLTGRRNLVASLAFSPDGRFVAAGRGGTHVWDLTDPGAKPAHFGQTPFASQVIFLPDGRFLGRTDLMSGGYLCDPRDPTRSARPVLFGRTSDVALALAPDGRRMYSCSHSQLRAWDATALPDTAEFWGRRPAQNCWYRPDTLAASADRVAAVEVRYGRAALSGRVPLLKVRHAQTAKELGRTVCPYLDPHRLAFSPDGTQLVLQAGGSLAAYDPAVLGSKPRKGKPLHQHILDLAFHPSGRLLATVGNDRTVRFWDAQALAETRAFEWSIGKLRAVTFSPDGTQAATGSHTGRVLLWDVDV